MRVVANLLFLGLAFGWAMPVAAQDNVAVSHWRTYCLETRGVRAEAFARAEAAGWTPSPQSPATARFHPDGSVLMITDNANGRSTCMTSHRTGSAATTAALEALLENPPTYTDRGWAVWVFDSSSGSLDWLANSDAEQMRAAVANDRVIFVRSGVQQGLDILMYEFPASMLTATAP